MATDEEQLAEKQLTEKRLVEMRRLQRVLVEAHCARAVAVCPDGQAAIDAGVNYFGAQLLVESLERGPFMPLVLRVCGKTGWHLVYVAPEQGDLADDYAAVNAAHVAMAAGRSEK